MKWGSFNGGRLFCRGSGMALERTAGGTQTVIPAALMSGDEELKIEVQ